MKELKEKVEKFIVDNKLEFNDSTSGLNGNCTPLAGFICYLINEEDMSISDGNEIIESLGLSSEAETELERVFDFAWYAGYEDFWKTEDAKETYVF